MKNKVELPEKVQSITTKALWLIILAIVAFILLNPTKGKAENLNALESKEMALKPKYKNENVRKYHKANRKRFQCTACPKRKVLGIFNRK